MSKYDGEVIEDTIPKSIEAVKKLFHINNIPLDESRAEMTNKSIFKKEICDRAKDSMEILYKTNRLNPREIKYIKCVCGNFHNELKCPVCESLYNDVLFEEDSVNKEG